MLVVKPESLQSGDGMMITFFTLPDPVTSSPLSPTIHDVVESTLTLLGLETGLAAQPVSVSKTENKLTVRFRRSDVTLPDGTTGTSFRLSGRFFSVTGPAFVAEDEVRQP